MVRKWFKFAFAFCLLVVIGSQSMAADVGKMAWDYLRSQGLSEVATAAVLGNFAHESAGLQTEVLQDTGNGLMFSKEVICDGRTGYGIAQWTFITRQQGLAEYARSRGQSSSDLYVQLDYALLEMQRDYPYLIDSLNTMASVPDATYYFMKIFENPGIPHLDERISWAIAYFNNKGVGVYNVWTGVKHWVTDYLNEFKVNIDFEGLFTLGENVRDILEMVAAACGAATRYLSDHALWLFGVLVTIDLALYCSVSAVGGTPMQTLFPEILRRVIRYGVIFFIISNWAYILQTFFVGFISGFTSTTTGVASVPDMLSSPDVMLRDNLALLKPSMTYFTNVPLVDFLQQIGWVIIHGAILLTGIFLYCFLAIMMTVFYLEFYIGAALSIFSLPFSVSKYAKFIPEASIGHVVTSGLKLGLTGMMLGFMHTSLGEMSYEPENFMSICIFLCAMFISVLLILQIPQKLTSMVGGQLELQ